MVSAGSCPSPVDVTSTVSRDASTCGGESVDRRLVPLNGVLDLATPDGLNPAPLARAGWRIVGLEVPVKTELSTVIIDLVLFNDSIGYLLGIEAKSGANIEAEQGRKLVIVTPQMLVEAGAITVRTAVTLQYEPMYACLDDQFDRVALGCIRRDYRYHCSSLARRWYGSTIRQ